MREGKGKEGWMEGGEREGEVAEREREERFLLSENRSRLKFKVVQEWEQLKHCLAR